MVICGHLQLRNSIWSFYNIKKNLKGIDMNRKISESKCLKNKSAVQNVLHRHKNIPLLFGEKQCFVSKVLRDANQTNNFQCRDVKSSKTFI